MIKIGVLVSGNGSNLQAIMDAIDRGDIPGQIVLVISDNPDAFALKRAAGKNIPTMVIKYAEYPNRQEFTLAILRALSHANVDLVCLAGFMRILSGELPTAYKNKIMNIHPALLPAFGGKGMYGNHVHEAVIASGAKFSGATVHFVTPETDVGPIIIQDIVSVEDNDTVETLAQKIHQVERSIYPLAVKLFAENRLLVEGMRVKIKKMEGADCQDDKN